MCVYLNLCFDQPFQVGDRGGPGDKEKKKKETILDLSKYLEKPIRVKFSGGREGMFYNLLSCADMPVETILDLSKYLEKPIRVKFSGGREGMFYNLLSYLVLTCP